MSWFRSLTKPKLRVKQHMDLRNDPQYRHQVHKTKSEILKKQNEKEWQEEVKSYVNK